MRCCPNTPPPAEEVELVPKERPLVKSPASIIFLVFEEEGGLRGLAVERVIMLEGLEELGGVWGRMGVEG